MECFVVLENATVELACRKQLWLQFILTNSRTTWSSAKNPTCSVICFVDRVDAGLQVADLEKFCSCAKLENTLCELT